MTSERRAFLRVEADLNVIVARLDASGEREPATTARAVDISAGGLRLAAGHGYRAGDRLWLEVRFRQPHFLVFAAADVLRIDDDGSAGVRFDELETYTQQRVVRWVYAQDRRLFDRRAQTRLPVRLKALVRRIAPDGIAVEEFSAPTLDISLEGVRIVTERTLEVDGRVEISIDFEDSLEPFHSAARVTWAEPAGDRLTFELTFADINPAQQRRLIERTLAAEKRLSP
ncbi:MAG: PilZ domain [Gaiellales bacterium]|jgi:c-di-GMP-binding flagellar brake protein YcgR|nr:PilZ domain [Gaiellales bacterium]